MTSRAVEPGKQDEPVEAVVLDGVGPHADERVGEDLAQLVDVDPVRRQRPELEVVQIVGAAVGGPDLVRLLAQDLEAHVLEDRQRVGEEHDRVAPEELEAQDVGPVLEPAIEAEAQGPGRSRGQAGRAG